MQRHNPWILPAWLSLGAILYITLLPFRFEDLSFAEAWETYRSMRFGELRASARQQWVANAFMFLPLGFFWMAWLTRGVRTVAGRMAVGVFVALLCLTVTATVEFIQAWIPRRVPSLIDLSGNFTGGVAGVLLWALVGPRLAGWRAGLNSHWLHSALTLYVIVYILAALVPFDFLLSWSEWQGKLASGHWGWWSAESGCNAGLRCGLLRGIEIVLTIPVGVWLVLQLRGLARRPWLAGAAVGIGFGIAMEIGQLLTVSGIAEGRSVLARAFGVMLGIQGYMHREHLLRPEWLGHHGRTLVAWLAAPYVLVLFLVNVGVRDLRFDLGRAAQTLSDLQWLPFYYHYMVSESVAIASVMLHLVMYAPVGAAVWLWGLAPQAPRRDRRLEAVLWAAGLALVMESGKLFVAGRHPDFTDVLIAAVAALAAFALLSWAWRQWLEPAGRIAAESDNRPSASYHDDTWRSASANDNTRATPMVMRVVAVALGGVTLVAALTWPVAAVWLLLGLVAYGAWLWRRPEAWLLVIPALIPVMNLSHLSGRFFFDELDLFVLATLAVAAWRWRSGRGWVVLPRPALWALAIFAGSMALSLLVALLPWQPIDVNAWSHYASQYNALRVAKGLAWALLLFALLRQSDQPVSVQVERWFVPGMAIGLVLGVLAVLRERLVYPGLLNFDSRYRISGLFTDMHAGGPSIETWLVMTAPFVLLWAWLRHDWRGWLPALVVFGLAIYALAVTYSRGGYLGMGVALLVLAVGVIAALRQGVATSRIRLAALVVLPLLVTGIVVSQVAGGFAGQRMGQVAGDMDQRIAHWSIARQMAATGGGINWRGRGLGSFPRQYHAGNPFGRIPGNYAIGDEAGERFLRLGRGDSLFINQRIGLPRVDGYRLEARLRADVPSRLSVHVCEKFIRYSFNCRAGRLEVTADEVGQWAVFDWAFDLGDFDDGNRLLRRGLTVALSHSGGDNLIAIDRLSLTGPDGRDYIANGGFDHGLRHWYPTTDNLWPWRVENQWLEIWFDQGWLGLLAFTALTLIAAVVMTRRLLLQGSLVHAFLLAALAGALAVGLFSTIFWSPRLMLLFFLILLLGLVFKDDSRAISAGMEPGPAPRR